MKVEKSQDPAEEDGNGGVETELAQRNAGIAQVRRRSNPTPSSWRTTRKPKMPASNNSNLPTAARPAGHAGSNQRRSTATPSMASTAKSRQLLFMAGSASLAWLMTKATAAGSSA